MLISVPRAHLYACPYLVNLKVLEHLQLVLIGVFIWCYKVYYITSFLY